MAKWCPADDFMSLVDTPYVWEMNMWYHTLNCGYRTRGSGETDFPCIYGQRVGSGPLVHQDGRQARLRYLVPGNPGDGPAIMFPMATAT